MILPTITLGAGGIETTPLGFGCATLFRADSAARRSNLLHVAHDCGIRHFDVAPMYGLGRAELELGTFIKTRRDKVTVATKFGIRPRRVTRVLAHLQRPVRRTFEAQPAVRDYARERATVPSRLLYESGSYSPEQGRRSLERSLRALRTEYIDLLLMHDPVPGSVSPDDICAFLEDARTAGLIRAWGIAGGPGMTDEVARSFPVVPVRQRPGGVLSSAYCDASPASALVTYNVLAGALPGLVRYLTSDEPRRLRWKRDIGADCGDPDVAGSFLLGAAWRANTSGVVLFGTVNPHRIRNAVDAYEANRGSGSQSLDEFCRLVHQEVQEFSGIRGEVS